LSTPPPLAEAQIGFPASYGWWNAQVYEPLNWLYSQVGTTMALAGADATGAVDAAPLVQALLNAARDAGGGWVVIPPGTYLIGSTLRIYSDTRLTLSPGARFKRGVAGTLLLNGDADQALGGWTGQSRILIEGGVWDMQGTTSGLTDPAMCISIGHASDITIRDIEVRDVSGYHAIELNSTKRGIVRDCRFLGYVDNTSDHSRGFSEAVQIDLAKGSAEFGGFGPYDNTVCEDILVEGCYFGASGTSGTGAWPRGIGSHSTTIGVWHRRVRIIGCTFDGITQYGIVPYSYEDCTIVGNTFMTCGSGVRVRAVIVGDGTTVDTQDTSGHQTGAGQTMRNITVTGNTFRDGQGYDDPIVVYGEPSGGVFNITIADNAIDGSTSSQNGIRVYNTSRAAVTGNTINNVSGTAISTENLTESNITGNVNYNPGANGITVVTSTYINVTGNNIREPDNNGILVQAGSDVHVLNNFVKSPGRSSGTYYGVRVNTAADSVTIAGNKARTYGSSPEAQYGCAIATGCTNVRRYGNDWRPGPGSWAVAALQDNGTSSNTSATDVTS
jgi:hypothetical protein